MSVLMRKPELVKRYCCVLQILESTIDLQNDDKLVRRHFFAHTIGYDYIPQKLQFRIQFIF